MKKDPVLLDCTFRDGGYYNNWDFKPELVNSYLQTIAPLAQVVELGFRSIKNENFKGPLAFTTDEYIETLNIPKNLQLAVMVNASELISGGKLELNLKKLFPNPSKKSRVNIVRIAAQFEEVEPVLPAVNWLVNMGYEVGLNLMQIADRTEREIKDFTKKVSKYKIKVLYFADSLGSLTAEQTLKIVSWLRTGWKGYLGFHAHNNMGRALQNTMLAYNNGVLWLDATVTGMGRGAGNAKTEELIVELGKTGNLLNLLKLINKYFKQLKNDFNYGENPYYFLAGKYGIHPTYIQSMLDDIRFAEEDILTTIEQLKIDNSKKYEPAKLEQKRYLPVKNSQGSWEPQKIMQNRELLILATGQGVLNHKQAIESYIKLKKPLVLAFNTQNDIDSKLIDFRIACHYTRMLADCKIYKDLNQPLITSVANMSEILKKEMKGVKFLDFGIHIKENAFEFERTYCVIPKLSVLFYALAIVASGKVSRLLLAGFDGYAQNFLMNKETEHIFDIFQKNYSCETLAVTQTAYNLRSVSIYGML